MKSRCISLWLAIVLCSLPMLADGGHDHIMAGEKLGAVSFPVSCSPAVQKAFERGVALLHSFEYEPAQNQFKRIAQRDPHCAMAYWGQAMSLYHQLWEHPSKADLMQGRKLLEQAQQLKPPTAREREYINALAVFYHDADKVAHPQRAAAYARAMEAVYQHNPQDREAAVFYALSLLGSDEADPTLANPRKAVAILSKIFDEQPDHPGVAHYIIHSCDNPQMASFGLEAARKYAAIAPASPHAVHMPSHIFARLGLWQDDIHSNLAALQAADKMEAMHLHVMHHRMHSMDFLQYAYLQIGEDHNAKAERDQLAKLRREDIEKDYRDYYDDMVSSFAARYSIERRQWRDALALRPLAGAAANIQLTTYWAHAIAAGHLHDPAAAQDALKTYERLMEKVKTGPWGYLLDGLKDEHEEVQAWVAYAEGKNENAIRLLTEVAGRQDKIGKGESDLPAREMLADMLMELGRAREALGEYEISLKTDPNRFNGLYGAAQAAEKLDQKKNAERYYAQLLKNCEGVNSDRAELAKARTLVAEE
ncbi:MAG: tetratricopeptide repeat protein [Candidatus Angelobacter sp.]